MNEELNRLERQRANHKTRLLNFNACTKMTGLHVDDIGWPLIMGRTPYSQITGPSFPDEDAANRCYDGNDLLKITATQMMACGAGMKKSLLRTGIVELVFQRVMKTLNNYCNHMFIRARFSKRQIITRFDVQALLSNDPFRFYLYFKHFYPEPREDIVEVSKSGNEGEAPTVSRAAPGFNNAFSAQLHRIYHDIPEYRALYDSSEHEETLRIKSAPLLLSRSQHEERIQALFQSDLHNNTYISPEGYLSAYYAQRFHEALGMPPMEKELIIVLDFLAKQCISEIVLRAIINCTNRNKGSTVGTPNLSDYLIAFEQINASFHGDILGLIPMNFRSPMPDPAPPEIQKDRQFLELYYQNRQRKAAQRYSQRQELNQYYQENYDRHFPAFLRTASLSGYKRERAR